MSEQFASDDWLEQLRAAEMGNAEAGCFTIDWSSRSAALQGYPAQAFWELSLRRAIACGAQTLDWDGTSLEFDGDFEELDRWFELAAHIALAQGCPQVQVGNRVQEWIWTSQGRVTRSRSAESCSVTAPGLADPRPDVFALFPGHIRLRGRRPVVDFSPLVGGLQDATRACSFWSLEVGVGGSLRRLWDFVMGKADGERPESPQVLIASRGAANRFAVPLHPQALQLETSFGEFALVAPTPELTWIVGAQWWRERPSGCAALVDGAVYPVTAREGQIAAGTWLLVASPRLRLDLSQQSLLLDEGCAETLRQARDACLGALRQRPRELCRVWPPLGEWAWNASGRDSLLGQTLWEELRGLQPQRASYALWRLRRRLAYALALDDLEQELPNQAEEFLIEPIDRAVLAALAREPAVARLLVCWDLLDESTRARSRELPLVGELLQGVQGLSGELLRLQALWLWRSHRKEQALSVLTGVEGEGLIAHLRDRSQAPSFEELSALCQDYRSRS